MKSVSTKRLGLPLILGLFCTKFSLFVRCNLELPSYNIMTTCLLEVARKGVLFFEEGEFLNMKVRHLKESVVIT